MKVVKVSDVKPEEATSKMFLGKTTRQTMIENDSKEIRANMINFSPGARNIFHIHSGDQLLWVTAGKGIVATESEEKVVTPGTMIFFPGGERHWHGAAPDSSFSHISITLAGQKTTF